MFRSAMEKYLQSAQNDSLSCLANFYQIDIYKNIPFYEEKQEEGTCQEKGLFRAYEQYAKSTQLQENNVKQYHLDLEFQLISMNQHIFSIKKYISKYYKLLSSKPLNKSKKSQNTQNLINSKSQEIKHTNFQEKKITGKQYQTFFEKYEKIQKLLDFINKQYSLDVCTFLIEIIYLTLTEYSKKKEDIINEEIIINFTKKLVDSSFLCSIGNILKGSTFRKENITLELKMFTIFMVNSIIFIAEEYYVNPYYQLQQKLIVRQFQDFQILLYDCALFDQQEDNEREVQRINGRKLKKL